MNEETTDAKALHDQRAFSYARIRDYRQKFIDSATGTLDAKYVHDRPCPVCGETKLSKLFDKSGGTYVKCQMCTMVFTNPVFTEEALKTYYRDLDTGQGEIVVNESAFYREIYQRGLKAIQRHRQTSTLLDLGCSTGFFLDLAKEAGWTTSGIELGTAEADIAKQKGHVVYTEPIEQLTFERPLDVITLWDVFEHIPNGKAFLQTLGSRLTPGGLVFMQIPSSDALAAKVLREECHMFDGLEHTNLYNPATIKQIASMCGFEVVDLQSVISEIAVLNNYLSYEDPYFGTSRYDNRAGLLGVIGEDVLHQNLLGYKMQVVLKKG